MWSLDASSLTMSKLEIIDAVSDGAAWTAVRIQETQPEFTTRLLHSWANGGWLAQHMAIGIETIGLSGCKLLSLCGATAAQALSAHALEGGPPSIKIEGHADLAGLGQVVSKASSSQGSSSHGEFGKAFLVIMGRVVYEALLQLFWQTSAIMAAGNSIIDSPVLVTSLVLSLASTAKKGIDLFWTVVEEGRRNPPRYIGGWIGAGVIATPIVIILAAVWWFTTKLVMAQRCPSHSWNTAFPPRRGCVEFSSLDSPNTSAHG